MPPIAAPDTYFERTYTIGYYELLGFGIPAIDKALQHGIIKKQSRRVLIDDAALQIKRIRGDKNGIRIC